MVKRRFQKNKKQLTFSQAIVITFVIHIAGLGLLWYSPVLVNRLITKITAPGPKIKQPAAPYSDALERAFLTIKDWSKTDKQLAGIVENKPTKKHK
jgi:hypothetical protein